MVIFLTRNLRKSLLQGHPWVYREALKIDKSPTNATSCLAVLKDAKKEFVAWGIYDPSGPLAFRVLSLKNKKPDFLELENQIIHAATKRKSLLQTQTNAFRLINGEGDFLPGLVCDVYDSTAVLQFDGDSLKAFWTEEERLNTISLVLQKVFQNIFNKAIKSIVIKERGASESLRLVWGKEVPPQVEVLENGVKFNVKILEGQKTGFFLDQRDNRSYVRQMAEGKKVLNLFSYTGGFSVYAGLGQAKEVSSVDISKGAIAQAQENWQLNGLAPSAHQGHASDVYDFLNDESLNKNWDMIIVDPPSMTHSEKQKPQAVAKYIDIFTLAAKKTAKGGDLIVSSCSSHISFDDFEMIISESLSKARRRGQILRVSGQGFDHPYLHAHPELRYLKFVHLNLL